MNSRPAPWKIVTLGVAIGGLGIAGAGFALAEGRPDAAQQNAPVVLPADFSTAAQPVVTIAPAAPADLTHGADRSPESADSPHQSPFDSADSPFDSPDDTPDD